MATMVLNRENALTRREKMILKMVSKGCTNKQIAEKLFISTNTVKNHLKNIFKKLGACNRIEALRKAAVVRNDPKGL